LIESYQTPSAVRVKSDLLDLDKPLEVPLAHFYVLSETWAWSRPSSHRGWSPTASSPQLFGQLRSPLCLRGWPRRRRQIFGRGSRPGKGFRELPGLHQSTLASVHWLGRHPQMAKLLSHPDSLNSTCQGSRIPLHRLCLRGTPLQWSVPCGQL